MSNTVRRSIECPGKTYADGYKVECGSTYYEKDEERAESGEWLPVWKCSNCCAVTPRREKGPDRTDTVTRTQRRLADRIKRRGEEREGTVWHEWTETLREDGCLEVSGKLIDGEKGPGFILDTHVFVIIRRRGRMFGHAIGFGTTRNIKTARDIWKVYR